MAKIQERETATDVAFYYNTEDIQSIDKLSGLLSKIDSLDGLEIERIQLINSYERSSEGGGSNEISLDDAITKLPESISDASADFIIIGTIYFEEYVSFGINLDSWVCSIATSKKNVKALNQLAELLGFENKKKGDDEMGEENIADIEKDSQQKSDQVKEVKPVEVLASDDSLLVKLDDVRQALANLQQSFDEKIAEDTYKNGLFDNMHRELVRYQNGVLEKIVDTIALDIIQLIDTTKSHFRVYEKKEITEENYKKLLKIVKGIAEDLEDILYRQNIESYRVPGHEVDVRRQKIIQTIPTDDKSKDNLIAVRFADGYEKGDKVLRPERIKIFKYEESPETTSEN